MRESPVNLFAEGAAAIPGSTAEAAITVADLTELTRAVVEETLGPVWVRGEITGFTKHRNGHWYFGLRDRTSQMRCVTWSRDQRGIPAPPDDGMQVVVWGQMTVYTARGDLQFTAKRIEAVGDGLWRKAMEIALANLRKDGLLEQSRKRRLPPFPRCVAVVTSPDGAAFRDIVSVLRRRNPAVEIVLCAAKVQGDRAAAEIARGILRAGRWNGAQVVIIGRGGGAQEDLWAFNDERLARIVAASPIPVISAVGHEVDTTVCDAVADYRAATPSAAAEAASGTREQMEGTILRARRNLDALMNARLTQSRRRIDRNATSMQRGLVRVVGGKRALLREAAGKLDVLSPLATLSRGYSVARAPDGSALTSAHQFHPGMDFDLFLRDGRVASTANDVSPEVQ